jgi:hypothetical protein
MSNELPQTETQTLSWEEVERHPFMGAIEEFAAATTPDDKMAAFEALLKNSQMFESLHNPSDDAVKNDNDRLLRQRVTEHLKDRPHEITQIVNIVEKAATARGMLYAGEIDRYGRAVESLEKILEDSKSPDIVAATDLAIQNITADEIDNHPEVFPQLFSHASTLYGLQNSGNFARLADGLTNQQEAVSLMRELVRHAENAYTHEVIGEQQVFDAIGLKYAMIHETSTSLFNENEADLRTGQEITLDKCDRFLSNAHDAHYRQEKARIARASAKPTR